MANEQLKDLCRRLYEGLNRRDYSVIDTILADSFVAHQGMPDLPPTREGFKQGLTAFQKGFPDYRFEIHDIVSEGSSVWLQLIVTGTNQGEFMGLNPTHKRIEVEMFEKMRIDRNKIVESWSVIDQMEIMQQLGATQLVGGSMAHR